VYAVFVEDLSLQGVRILSERVNGIGPGSTVVGIFAGHEGLGEVRSVQPHPNERLAFYGVRFVTIPEGLARIVRKIVASARQDPASWW
jgi:hypothetical protein